MKAHIGRMMDERHGWIRKTVMGAATSMTMPLSISRKMDRPVAAAIDASRPGRAGVSAQKAVSTAQTVSSG